MLKVDVSHSFKASAKLISESAPPDFDLHHNLIGSSLGHLMPHVSTKCHGKSVDSFLHITANKQTNKLEVELSRALTSAKAQQPPLN